MQNLLADLNLKYSIGANKAFRLKISGELENNSVVQLEIQKGLSVLSSALSRAPEKVTSVVSLDMAERSLYVLLEDCFHYFHEFKPTGLGKPRPVQTTVFKLIQENADLNGLHNLCEQNFLFSFWTLETVSPEIIKIYVQHLVKSLEPSRTASTGSAAQSQEVDFDQRGVEQQIQEAYANLKNLGKILRTFPGQNRGMRVAEDPLLRAKELLGNSAFLQIADLFGRLESSIESDVQESPEQGVEEIFDIGLGTDLQRILPSELIKLKFAKSLFLKDFAEGKLLQYLFKPDIPNSKGPIIVLLDISGSMEFENRSSWAVAATIALLHLAEVQRRPFALITFDDQVRMRKRISPLHIEDYMDFRDELANVKFSGGGTSFYPALKEAFQIRNEDADFKPADVVMITDGDDASVEFSLPELKLLKEEADTRLQVLQLGEDFETTQANLGSICDGVYRVDDLSSIHPIRSVIEKSTPLSSF